MKRKLLVICGVLLVAIGIYDFITNKPTEPTFVREEAFFVEEPTDAMSYLIDRIHTPVKGAIIAPKTTEELRAWFKDADIQRTVPRIYVDRLPDDFAQQGDKDLFAKVIAALILRENEQSLKERAALLLLKNKMDKNETWTDGEQDLFMELVQKYDAKSRKTIPAQMADLLVKVNAIPPMIAVIQAAEATDWGRQHTDSPYEQTGWLDRQTYARIPFDSLIQATESYAREMNGMPPLENWRFSRANLMGRGYTDAGTRILRWLNEYKLEDLKYTEGLYRRLDELGYEIPDTLSFAKEPAFETQQISVNGHKITVEVARTEEQKQQGLMFRSKLPKGTGMIFINTQNLQTAVWMKNTFIPLDIIFFDEAGTVVRVQKNATPLDETHIKSEQPVRGFLELPAGDAEEYQIKNGSRLMFPKALFLNQN